jgi:hypothetical protein
MAQQRRAMKGMTPRHRTSIRALGVHSRKAMRTTLKFRAQVTTTMANPQ